MYRSKIYLLVSLFAGGILIVAALHFLTGIYQGDNGFVRKLPPNQTTPGNVIVLTNEAWYIAGLQDSILHMGNMQRPLILQQFHARTEDSSNIQFAFPTKQTLFKGCFASVDSSGYYLYDGIGAAVYKADVENREYALMDTPTHFASLVPISSNSIVVRSIENEQNILQQYSFASKKMVKNEKLLQKQVDGLFCTDGILVNVPGSDHIMYVYYYRNEFLCADSGLNLLYRGKTIDTVSQAKIKVSRIASTNEITLSAPPVFVNKHAAANEKYLFVHSALKASNEKELDLEDFTTIDAYNVKDGSYKHSFYLPNFRKEKIKEFKVFGNTLVALFGKYVCLFTLNF